MYQSVTDIVQQQGTVSEITLDELSQALIERGSHDIPDSIKDEMMVEIDRACSSARENNQ
jgi:hypothetical protein